MILKDNNHILISKKRLVELLNEESELDALIAAGVDNWDGYDERERIEKMTVDDLAGQDVFEG